MLRIRLRRVGKKGKPSYRIVVAEASSPRDGAYLEWIGNYDPMGDPPVVSLKEDRAVEWLSKGAQPSDAVMRILDKNGIIQRTPLMRTRTRGAAEDAPTVTVRPVAATPVVTVERVVEDEAVAVDEAATVDEPVAVDEAATVDEAVAVDEAATVDEAVAVDEAATVDEAVAVDEAATGDDAATEAEAATDDEIAADTSSEEDPAT